METWVRGSVRRPLGAASAWLTTAPSLTAADGSFSRNPQPGAQEGVSSISTFNTPRTVIGLVGPRGAHAEVGPGTQLGEAHDFFWGRRGQKESRRGLGSLASFVQTRLVLGASLAGSFFLESTWDPTASSGVGTGFHRGTTPQIPGFLPDLKAEKAKAWESVGSLCFRCSFLRLDLG